MAITLVSNAAAMSAITTWPASRIGRNLSSNAL